jgi:DNA-binding PadR family transcriptional regulator
MDLISRTEEIVLLAIWRLQEDAYGVTIRDELTRRTGKDWSLGSIYAPLHRLERKGFVTTRHGDPESRRGGRRTVLYDLTKKGRQALVEVKAVQDSLWQGIANLQPDRS